MRDVLLVTLFAFVLVGTHAQKSSSDAQVSGKEALKEIQSLAPRAYEPDRIDDEVSRRGQLSEKVWAGYARDPKPLNKYELYDFILFNDVPLALLLEGTHQWTQAEQTFRHNQSELTHMRIAGSDIKSENQLLLAYLLASEGQQREAKNICRHWKSKVGHLADGYLWAMKHDVPRIPPDQIVDTNEIEMAKWDLACGYPQDGLTLIAQQKAAHPYMLRSYEVLREYYAANGEFKKARKEEEDWNSINRHNPENHESNLQ